MVVPRPVHDHVVVDDELPTASDKTLDKLYRLRVPYEEDTYWLTYRPTSTTYAWTQIAPTATSAEVTDETLTLILWQKVATIESVLALFLGIDVTDDEIRCC